MFTEQSYSFRVILFILAAILIQLPNVAYGSICTGTAASPNWYGAIGYPPWLINNSSESCPQKYSLSRCEQSAVMRDGTSNFTVDSSGVEVCNPNVDCYPTKQNCNDTLVCSDLLKLKDELLQGGHNIVCRHEKTYWSQYTGEAKNCQLNENCLDSEVKVTQRQLQPLGWKSADNFAKAFREMGIPVEKTFSSPFTRCAEHAQVFSDEPNEELIELMYMAPWEEILELNNITDKIKVNALKWQAYNLRNLAGQKPSPGKNNVFVTHGFNIKLSFGTAVDEGYCMVLKPEDSEPSLGESIGSLTVSNREFYFSNESYPVDAIARMSPESAVLMQTCNDVQLDSINNTEDVLTIIDTDNDMKITKEEFTSAHGSLTNTDDAFDFILSTVIQPELLGKPQDESPSIELGQFYHINWGWREYLKTEGDISYPWRSILENTIGRFGNYTPEDRIAAFKQANSVLSNLILELRNDIKYPSKAAMEDKLINCNTDDLVSQHINTCAAQAFLSESGGAAYIPIGPGDGGAASLSDESIYGVPLAYPSQYIPDFFESRLLKVANCLVAEKYVSLSNTLESMGCDRVSAIAAPPTPSPTTTPPTPLPTPSPTPSPTKSTCAVEWEKSKECRATWAKNNCCKGLVCHAIHRRRCVKVENKYCSGPKMYAQQCDRTILKAPKKCCEGLVCDHQSNKCVEDPNIRYRHHDHPESSSTAYPTSSPTITMFNNTIY